MSTFKKKSEGELSAKLIGQHDYNAWLFKLILLFNL